MTAFTIVILLGLVRDKDEVQWRGPKSTTMTYSPEGAEGDSNRDGRTSVGREVCIFTGRTSETRDRCYLALGGNV
ncbi:unnamed protein product [Fusarium fujikuroi]|nr:unnamed protein product [Fusarium fujikuroi]